MQQIELCIVSYLVWADRIANWHAREELEFCRSSTAIRKTMTQSFV
jgi:hypothetical protein